jgi:tellurite resistance protein
MSIFNSLLGGSSNDLAELEKLFLSKSINPKDQKYLACFSLLLAKIANADNQVTQGERARIKELLIKHAELSPGNAEVASEVALKKSLVASLEVKTICDQLLTCAPPEQLKSVMLACLYVAADGGISDVEVQRMHSIARMLGFSFKAWQEVLNQFNGSGAEQAS